MLIRVEEDGHNKIIGLGMQKNSHDQLLKIFVLFAVVTLLSFPSAVMAFSWVTFTPAITTCNSYPFPSCRARTLCKTDGKYWYDGICNDEKHPDQVTLEKLDGKWTFSLRHKSKCGGFYFLFSGAQEIILDKNTIADDNLQVMQFEGSILSIMQPRFWMPQGPDSQDLVPVSGRYYRYAILFSQPEFTYMYKSINNIDNMVSSSHCALPDGTWILDFKIEEGDTAIYYFNITADRQFLGKLHYVNADVWFDLVDRNSVPF